MPSAAATLLSAGFTALLATNGETLTLTRADGSTVSLTALVQWADAEGELVPNFEEEGGSVIKLFSNAVSPPAKVGEHFTDENGVLHRIQKQPTQYMAFLTYVCSTSR